MKKILFLCKEKLDDYGKSYGLFNSASFIVNYLTSIKVQSKNVRVIDANCIDREVSNFNPDIVILEAIWVTPEKIKELLSIKKYSSIKWIIRIHSKIPFLANEGIAFKWLNEYKDIQKQFSKLLISANSEETNNDIASVLKLKCIYLPNIYFPIDYKHEHHHKKDQHIDIGCFGAIRPLKNHLIQAIACIEYGNEHKKKIRFHINHSRIEMQGENIYKNLKALFENSGHELVEHKWMEHEEFIRVVKKMDLGLQVSMSESFNIVAADFVWNEIPFIGSNDIEWLPTKFKVNPSSSKELKNKIKFVFNFKFLESILDPNKRALHKYNNKAKNSWCDLAR